MARFLASALALLAGLCAGSAAAQASDETHLAIQLGAGDSRTVFVSGKDGSIPVFSVCLDRVNGKRVILHIADSSTDMSSGTTQALPAGGCLFASGRILYLTTDPTNTEPGFEGATALITVTMASH